MILEWILLAVFVVSSVVGYFLINKVPPLLHTPLMSGMNALSGVTITGALLTTSVVLGRYDIFWSGLFGGLAIITAAINLVGGFLLTDRMLKMFRNRKNNND